MRLTAKTSRTIAAPAALLALAATVAGLSGCGGAQGVTTGASAPTAITIRHGKEKGEAAPVAAKGGGEAGRPAAASGGVGTFKGKVVMEGTPKPLESLTAEAETKAPICAKAGIPNEKLVLGEGNGVANVFVFLPKAARRALPCPRLPASRSSSIKRIAVSCRTL